MGETSRRQHLKPDLRGRKQCLGSQGLQIKELISTQDISASSRRHHIHQLEEHFQYHSYTAATAFLCAPPHALKFGIRLPWTDLDWGRKLGLILCSEESNLTRGAVTYTTAAIFIVPFLHLRCLEARTSALPRVPAFRR